MADGAASVVPPTVDDEAAVERLRSLVRIPTMSPSDEQLTDWASLDRFVAALEAEYPAIHRELEREILGGHSVLYRWKGRGTGEPTILMAHYDVVVATEEGWEHPPFSADLIGTGDDRTVWGRGTLDDKGALVAIMEAVESLVAAGFQPAHDIYLSFGHDEERGGSGAAEIARTIQARGIRPALVIDEGGAVVSDFISVVRAPLAVIGVSEKGQAHVTLTVEQHGGHAATPPRLAATVRLARAITRLNSRPFPSAFSTPNRATLSALGDASTGSLGFVLRRQRLFGPLLLAAFGRLSDDTRAIVRTTAAVTQLQGSLVPNALPERAEAVVNVRVAVGSSVQQAVDHIRRAVRDPLVAVEVSGRVEPSPVSPTSGPAWNTVATAISAVYPDAVVTPYVMLQASDGRHFARFSPAVYRFMPFQINRDEYGTLHARNERIRVATWIRGIEFYQRVILGR